MQEPRSSLSRGKLFALVVLTVVIGAVVVLAFQMLFVVFAGLLFAIVLRGASAWISRVTRAPYVAVLVFLVLVGLTCVVFASISLATTVGEQLETFGREFPKIVDALRQRVQQLPGLHDAFSSQATTHFNPKVVAHGALDALGGTVHVLTGLVIAFFIGVYGAAQPHWYSRAALAVTPKRYERHVQRALEETSHNLGRWLWGRILAMIFVGVATSIVFQVLDLPLALTLGVLAGLLTFIEYAGAIISAVPPVLFGFAQSPTAGFTVLAAYVVVHVIEGYVLTPMLARVSVHLPPALTLVSQMLLGEIAGVLGLTFSTPLFVVAVSITNAFREEQEASLIET